MHIRSYTQNHTYTMCTCMHEYKHTYSHAYTHTYTCVRAHTHTPHKEAGIQRSS